MRFVHLADVHLDTPSPGRTEALRRRLREASHEALRRCFALARREQVDAVLIAGDLFDGVRLSFQTERFLLSEMQALDQAGVQVVYATGNHDPVSVGGRAAGLAWPPNVVVAAGVPPVRVAIGRPGEAPVGHVTAAGHGSSRESRDLSKLFPAVDGEGPEVGLLHTQVEATPHSAHHRAYAPSDLEHLKSLGYDYWALGHVHQRQVLSQGPLICYAGNPQGRTFNETGAKGCLLVDLRALDGPRATFHETGTIRFEVLKVTGLEGPDTLDRLLAHTEEAWAQARRADPNQGTESEWIVRVELEGPTPLATQLGHPEERETLGEELAARLGALWVDVWTRGAYPLTPLDDHAGRNDHLGEALRLLGHVRTGRIDVLSLAPSDLAGAEDEGRAGRSRYLSSLLDGASGELIARMVVDPSAEGKGRP